jgi:hypothetical protein
MRKPTEAKTPEQLVREIAYFAAALQRTTSADRIRRAHVSIRKRERLLVEARRQILATSPPTTITCPRCHLVSYNPSDIRERYCGFCHRFHTDPTLSPQP